MRQLDDFLEFFENLYYAVLQRLVGVEDVLVFLRYYIILLGDAYYDSKEQCLKHYVDHYYYNIVPLLDLVESHLRKNHVHLINRIFENYPRR